MIPRALSIHPSDFVAILLEDAKPDPVKVLGHPGDPVIEVTIGATTDMIYE
jgi:hypothetical protein